LLIEKVELKEMRVLLLYFYFLSAEVPKYDGLPYDDREEKLINKLLDKKKYSPLVRPVRG
jgi:hypothetical protein